MDASSDYTFHQTITNRTGESSCKPAHTWMKERRWKHHCTQEEPFREAAPASLPCSWSFVPPCGLGCLRWEISIQTID